MARVLLDLNDPGFQEDWFLLGREDASAVISTLRKIRQLEWEQIYSDRGLRWEATSTQRGGSGRRLYSLRVTKRMRALAFRQGDFLRLVSLHPDHDSAYQ